MGKKYKQKLLSSIKEYIGAYLVTNFTVAERNILISAIEEEFKYNGIDITIGVDKDLHTENYFDRKDY